MSKIKKIVITATLVTLIASGTTYSICKDKSKEFERYMSLYQDGNDDLLICAHRGFSSLEVENTIKSISLASSKDYIDYIEFDIRLSNDGKIIVSHDNILKDENINFVTISETNYDELLNNKFIYNKDSNINYLWYSDEVILINNRNKTLNNQKYQLSSLKEIIEATNNKNIILDIKFNNDIEELVNELEKELNGIDTSNIIFQSFNVDGMKYIMENTNYECQLLVSGEYGLNHIDDFSRIGLKLDLVNYDLIDGLINKNKKIAIWTINNSNELNYVLDNVGEYYKDIIYITDYPDLIITRLKEKEIIKKII